MRVALPLAEEPEWPPGMTVRTFEPGHDEADWLRVNNRAFAGHPDQGGWTAATLARRDGRAVVRPRRLFLLAVDADGLAGFCWTKVHDAAARRDPALGEIYVIGVDPRAQGTGLGRALADRRPRRRSHDRGASASACCSSPPTTRPRVGLYRSLGFEIHRTDRAYARDGRAGRIDA